MSRVLDLRGPRGALTAAAARELCACTRGASGAECVGLIASTWALGGGDGGSAAEVAAAIARMPRLREAVLADCIAGRPEAEGLEVLSRLGAALAALPAGQLQVLDISDNAVRAGAARRRARARAIHAHRCNYLSAATPPRRSG